jgi:hypothetical protein
LIPPGGLVTFEMQLRVDSRVEPDELFWDLRRASGNGVGDDARVVVTR